MLLRVTLFLSLLSLMTPAEAKAKLRVVTTTTTLKSLVQAVGSDKVDVESVTRPGQDPHFLEAKPSYMVKLRNADLLVSVGLDLEVGWLENVIHGARNPELRIGQPGHLVTGSLITAIEVPTGRVDRAEGDIHPFGNPHYYLDPRRTEKVVKAIAERLEQLDADNAQVYEQNAERFLNELKQRDQDWEKRIREAGVKSVVSYHSTLNYFLSRYGIKLLDSIEPKPGIPPSSRHIIALIKKLKATPRACILHESFFETKPSERLQAESGAKFVVVPTEVGAVPGADNYIAMMSKIVTAIETCGKEGKP